MAQESIHIRFDKSHLLTIGEKLYGESLELIRELVCNAYDADAQNVWINVAPETLTVRDDGWGMNEEGLREYFNIGSRNKRESPVSPYFKRPRIGQFGIGKFASLAACKRFRVTTQQSDFRAEVCFDKDVWNESDEWHVPLMRLPLTTDDRDGTTITLEALTRSFALPDIERFIRERLPLSAPQFSIYLNGELLQPTIIPGKRFPVDLHTPFGDIRGELILPNIHGKKQEECGVECMVKNVVICRSTFGFDLPIMNRIRGRISADFLPITSDRSRFIVDTPEYRAFLVTLYKELHTINRKIKDDLELKEKQKADITLRDTLSRMRRAIRRNPDIAPPLMSGTGELVSTGQNAVHPMASATDAQDADALDAMQISMHEHQNMFTPESVPQDETKEDPPKKIRVKNLQGKTVLARSIAIGGIGITCAMENCGKMQPAVFTEAGVVYINLDHPLYKKQATRGQEMLGFYLSYLVSQQVALLLAEGDCRKAFDAQNRLLTDSW